MNQYYLQSPKVISIKKCRKTKQERQFNFADLKTKHYVSKLQVNENKDKKSFLIVIRDQHYPLDKVFVLF